MAQQCVPPVGSEPKPELPDGFGGKPSLFYVIVRRLCLRQRQAGVEKSRCLAVGFVAPAPQSDTRVVNSFGGHIHAGAFAQQLYGFGVVYALYIPDEVYGISAHSAAEAVVRLRVAVNYKARRFFGVERTQRNGRTRTAVLYLGVFADKLFDIDTGAKLRKKIFTEPQAVNPPLRKKIPSIIIYRIKLKTTLFL